MRRSRYLYASSLLALTGCLALNNPLNGVSSSAVRTCTLNPVSREVARWNLGTKFGGPPALAVDSRDGSLVFSQSRNCDANDTNCQSWIGRSADGGASWKVLANESFAPDANYHPSGDVLLVFQDIAGNWFRSLGWRPWVLQQATDSTLGSWGTVDTYSPGGTVQASVMFQDSQQRYYGAGWTTCSGSGYGVTVRRSAGAASGSWGNVLCYQDRGPGTNSQNAGIASSGAAPWGDLYVSGYGCDASWNNCRWFVLKSATGDSGSWQVSEQYADYPIGYPLAVAFGGDGSVYVAGGAGPSFSAIGWVIRKSRSGAPGSWYIADSNIPMPAGTVFSISASAVVGPSGALYAAGYACDSPTTHCTSVLRSSPSGEPGTWATVEAFADPSAPQTEFRQLLFDRAGNLYAVATLTDGATLNLTSVRRYDCQ